MSGAYGAVGDDVGPPPRGGGGSYDRGGRFGSSQGGRSRDSSFSGSGRGYGGDRSGGGGGYQGGDRGGGGGGYQGGDRGGGGGGYQGGDRGGGGGGGYQGGDRGYRGGGSGGRGGGRGGREGDWVCPDSNCGNVNFARRTECNKCGTPNPTGSGGNRGDAGGGYNSRNVGGSDSYSNRGRGGYNGDSGERGGNSHGSSQGRDSSYGQVPPPGPVSYGAPTGSYPPPNTYPSEPAQSQASSYGATGSYPPTYGAPPPNSYPRQAPRSDTSGGGGGGSSYGGSGSYSSANVDSSTKVKQCDDNCDETCDNARIYISNLPPDVTIDELQELFGGIGLVGKIKQKRGYKDQWPWNIKIYTDDDGKNKGDACLAYEDPSAAHSAGGFFNNYELRGHRIGVTMAEKSAPKAPAFGHGGGRGGYGGGRRYNDGGSGPDRNFHGGQRSRPY